MEETAEASAGRVEAPGPEANALEAQEQPSTLGGALPPAPSELPRSKLAETADQRPALQRRPRKAEGTPVKETAPPEPNPMYLFRNMPLPELSSYYEHPSYFSN